MAKFTQLKLDIILLFLNDAWLSKLFFLPIGMTSFRQLYLLSDKNASSFLGMDYKSVEILQTNFELALRDFAQLKVKLKSLQKQLTELTIYAKNAKKSVDNYNKYQLKINKIINYLILEDVLDYDSSTETFAFSRLYNQSPYLQFDSLFKYKSVDLHVLQSGKTTLNHFISLIDIEAKKFPANLKKLSLVKKIILTERQPRTTAFYLNLGIHPLHEEKFTQDQIKYYHQQLKIWLRRAVPYLKFVSIARNDINKGYNIHLFFVSYEILNMSLIRDQWLYLTSNLGIWSHQMFQNTEVSNHNLVNIAKALCFLGPIIKNNHVA